MPETTLTREALVDRIWQVWREEFPEALAGIPEHAQLKAARARAKMAEWEMEPLMATTPGMTREEAWGQVAGIFLANPPEF